MAEDYSYNSPYAFSENRVIDARELEGLEPKSVVKKDNKGNYQYTKSATFLLNKITGINSNLIENTSIKRRTGLSGPWANAKKSGGAQTLKGQITFTKNYFQDWDKSPAFYGDNSALAISEWLTLSAHEVGHLFDAENMTGFNYILTFVIGYIVNLGHDKFSKEIEAEEGRVKMFDFFKVVGAFNVINIFANESLSEDEKIIQLNELLTLYNLQNIPPPSKNEPTPEELNTNTQNKVD